MASYRGPRWPLAGLEPANLGFQSKSHLLSSMARLNCSKNSKLFLSNSFLASPLPLNHFRARVNETSPASSLKSPDGEASFCSLPPIRTLAAWRRADRSGRSRTSSEGKIEARIWSVKVGGEEAGKSALLLLFPGLSKNRVKPSELSR